MNYEELRITKLRSYLLNVIHELSDEVKQINVDMLREKPDNYSLDKIPTESVIEKWIMGIEIHRDLFSFRIRKEYSIDVINNLNNIGFFEKFESKIKDNNKKGILPEIDGIESIECLNCGAMISDTGQTAIFDIQVQITYRV